MSVACLRSQNFTVSVSVACLRFQNFTLSVSVACLQTRCRQRLSADKLVCVRLTLAEIVIELILQNDFVKIAHEKSCLHHQFPVGETTPEFSKPFLKTSHTRVQSEF